MGERSKVYADRGSQRKKAAKAPARSHARTLPGQVNSILRLQRTAGNQAVLRMAQGGLLQGWQILSRPADFYRGEKGRVRPNITTLSYEVPYNIQRMKFDKDGYKRRFLKISYDTSDIEEFKDWIDKLAQQDKSDILDRIESNLRGIKKPSRDEAIALSTVRWAIDKKREVPKAPEDSDELHLTHLPKSLWWKLFIEKGAQNEGESLDVNALRFDMENSPGYYGAMMMAFHKYLKGVKAGSSARKTGYKEYSEMHEMVTKGVLSKQGKGVFEPVPHELSGSDTNKVYFPMTKDNVRPSLKALKEMEAEGVLGINKGYHMKPERLLPPNMPVEDTRLLFDMAKPEIEHIETLKKLKDYHARVRSVGIKNSQDRQYLVDVAYKQKEAPQRIQGLFDGYHKEVSSLDKEENEEVRKTNILGAIVRLIRALHVGHFFADANGRLNTILLLNKLLMEEGFSPVIMDDTAIFGGRMSVDELIQEVLKGMGSFKEAVAKTHDIEV